MINQRPVPMPYHTEICRLNNACWKIICKWPPMPKEEAALLNKMCIRDRDTAGKNAKKIQEYIQRQYEQDKAGKQLTMLNFLKARSRAASDRIFAAGRSYLRGVTRTLVF